VRDPRRFAGRAGLGDSASGRVAATFMHAMWTNSHDIPGVAGASLGNILAELVGLALAGEAEAIEPSAAAALRNAYGAIERRLGDPDLSPASVAHEMQISVRTLHAIFQRSEDSFSAYVRKQRLKRCAADLQNIADRRSISEIAWRWGFNESAHFSRVFRDTYGVSPREFRARQVAKPHTYLSP
jgi:AraC-like DNA-binding protein